MERWETFVAEQPPVLSAGDQSLVMLPIANTRQTFSSRLLASKVVRPQNFSVRGLRFNFTAPEKVGYFQGFLRV